jgi:hypothetical protein
VLEILGFGLLLVLLAGAGLGGARLHARQRTQLWRAAAEQCGLTDITESTDFTRFPFPVPELTAAAGGLRVRLEDYRDEQSQQGTQIVVERADCYGLSLELRPEGFGNDIRKLFGGETHEIVIGDASFDRLFLIVGNNPAFTGAFLDAGMRQTLLGIQGNIQTLVVADGELRVHVPRNTENGLALARVLGQVIDIGRRMPGRHDLVARLAHNARHETEAAIREYNLGFLAGEFRRSPGATEALREALTDDSLIVRVRAAVGLGQEADPLLLRIAHDADESCAAEAISALGTRLPPAQALDLLARALASRRGEVARACVPVVARIGGEDAEAKLREALDSNSRDARAAAAEALGRVGSALAVEPLKIVERRMGDDELSRIAREAIAMIQDRASGTPGQLSLTEASAGQVSLSDGAAGRVSLPAPGPTDRDSE